MLSNSGATGASEMLAIENSRLTIWYSLQTNDPTEGSGRASGTHWSRSTGLRMLCRMPEDAIQIRRRKLKTHAMMCFALICTKIVNYLFNRITTSCS